ncbi:MAG TPA: tetratricopeptide repeat protein [Blastocatellia bacterium]|nr:tetratricopeptide repeat protein [Blastocatellia bacterium]
MAQLEFRFAGFTFRVDEYTLVNSQAETTPIPSRVYDLLMIMVQNPGYGFSRNELIDKIWGKGGNVLPSAINGLVSRLRVALGENGKSQKTIQTLHGNGYRFVPEVRKFVDGVEIADCNLPAPVIDHSQTSPAKSADIYQELAEIKNTLRHLEGKIDYLTAQVGCLASMVSHQSIWISVMWHEISESKRASIIYDSVQWANKRLTGPEQEVQVRTIESLGDRVGETFAYYQKISSPRELELAILMGPFWEIQGEWLQGCEILQAALTPLCDEASDARAMGSAWLSYLMYCQDNYESAQQEAKKAVRIGKQIGNDEAHALALNTLGSIARSKGNYDQARSAFTESLATAQRAKIDWLISWTLRGLGRLAEVQEDYGFAENWYLKGLAKIEESQDGYIIPLLQTSLSAVTCKQNNIDQAKFWVEKSLESRNKEVLSSSYFNLGLIEESSGNSQGAFGHYKKSLSLCQEIADKRGQARALEAMAKATYLQGNEKESAGLYGLADKIRMAIAAPLSPSEQKSYGGLILSAKKKYSSEFSNEAVLLGKSEV